MMNAATMTASSRGTPFTREVIAAVRRIPKGRVATYGQIAALAGREHGARGVAWILHSSSDAAGLPWHRVVGAAGRISLGRGRGFEEQRRRLIAEGIAVGRGGRIDLELYRWEPSRGAAGQSPGAKRFLRGILTGKP